MKYITVKLTEDQANDIEITYGHKFYDNLDADNQYAHFCSRLRIKILKAIERQKNY